jgi:hypothetical protein
MKKFSQFITEAVQKKALHVFDIDDTLMHTTAKIHVKSPQGKVVDTLTNQEFNDHRLPAGHSYDFGEFRSAEKFNKESKPLDRMVNHLKRVTANPSNHVILNTARANFDDKHTFLNTFKKHGIDMNNIHVIRAGNINTSSLPAEKKATVIHGYIKKHKYNNVHMYDDSKTNLVSFLRLKTAHPNTTFHAHHVEGGDIRRTDTL